MNFIPGQETDFLPGKASLEKVRDDEGVIASTRGRVRSPDCRHHFPRNLAPDSTHYLSERIEMTKRKEEP
jgi:hypothetical protein